VKWLPAQRSVAASREAEDHTPYVSHTVWENRATFEAWTKSEAFRAAHRRAGGSKPLYLDHPQFEGLRFARRWDTPRQPEPREKASGSTAQSIGIRRHELR
jgi:hypothetical protein